MDGWKAPPARSVKHVFFRLLIGLLIMLAGCGRPPSAAPGKRVIVLGVDGMDPNFVARHWDALPNLKQLRDEGGLLPLATTTPPQSPISAAGHLHLQGSTRHSMASLISCIAIRRRSSQFPPWRKRSSPRTGWKSAPTSCRFRERVCGRFAAGVRSGGSWPSTAFQ